MSWELEAGAAARAVDGVLAAFPDARFPQGVDVSTGGLWFDERGDPHRYADPEAEEVARFFGRRRWTEVAPDALLAWSHAGVSMTFLEPRAQAFYAPAFLRAFLTAPLDGVAIAVLENTIRRWTPPAALAPRLPETRPERQKAAMDDAEARRFQRFVDALTSPQKGAVAEALTVLAPPFDEPDLENPVRTALDAYWGAHLAG